MQAAAGNKGGDELPEYVAQEGQVGYGFSMGILCLECNIPFIPGDVGNASTYDFPVQYMVVPGATTDAIVNRQDPTVGEEVVRCAKALVGQGVKAITSDCGYLGVFQRMVADSVPVPVFMSSLMQVPLIRSMLGSDRRLGIMVANGQSVSDSLLAKVGLEDASRLVFRGLEEKPHFYEVIFEEKVPLDQARMEGEVVETVLEMQKDAPDLGAIMLECSDLPPYSAAIQRSTGLPVFDWIGFINYVHHAVVSRPYDGIF